MNRLPKLFRQVTLALLALVVVGCAQQELRQPLPPTVQRPEPVSPTLVKKLPKLGLALGGGAARGFAHIGVIQVLEEAGIHPDLVVGTSAGSVVAALYASGKNGKEIQGVALSMDEASFSDWRLPLFKPGVFRGEALARFISVQVKGRQIQELPMPLGVVATDLRTGLGVLFQRGDTATAVRASSAVPAVFQPVSIAGRDYVDGGLVSPVPVVYAQKMGAELVLAVDISSEPDGKDAQDSFQILMQTFAIMAKSINAFELQAADVVVKPWLTGLASASFSSRADAIQSGRQAMLAQLPALRRLMAAKSK
ncbi:MAG: patatin-like phospholipase family protein [Rhodoferax sp.]